MSIAEKDSVIKFKDWPPERRAKAYRFLVKWSFEKGLPRETSEMKKLYEENPDALEALGDSFMTK